MANIESVKLPNGNEYNIKDAISGYALQSEMSVTDGTGTDADKTTIQLKSGTSATVLKTHQSISGKADKVTGATNGNLASLDGNGNLTDAGVALNISTPSNGQLMKYNGTSGKWENADAPASAPMPNLLLNPWFTVNQRGFSSETITSEKYTVDRWIATGQSGSSGTFAKTSSGFSITASSANSAYIQQRFEDTDFLNGRTVTMSVMLSDGTIKSGTATIDTSTSTNLYDDSDITLRHSASIKAFQITVKSGKTIVIKALKLELGSTSTLHLDTAPDYTTELLKCQRYYWSIDQLILMYKSTTELIAAIETPTTMRATPTMSNETLSSFLAIVGGSSVTPTNISFSNTYAKGTIVTFTGSGFSNSNIYRTRKYIYFDAEL